MSNITKCLIIRNHIQQEVIESIYEDADMYQNYLRRGAKLSPLFTSVQNVRFFLAPSPLPESVHKNGDFLHYFSQERVLIF